MKTSNIDETKYFSKLMEYVRSGRINKKEQVEQILDIAKISVKDFSDWVFKTVGKSLDFNDLSKLIDIGVLPKTFVTRKLKYEDKFDKAPMAFQEKYARPRKKTLESLIEEIHNLSVTLQEIAQDLHDRGVKPTTTLWSAHAQLQQSYDELEELLDDTEKTASKGSKNFDDPWKVMSPEDRAEANRLFRMSMKAFPSSPRQKELSDKLHKILKKYGIGKKSV